MFRLFVFEPFGVSVLCPVVKGLVNPVMHVGGLSGNDAQVRAFLLVRATFVGQTVVPGVGLDASLLSRSEIEFMIRQEAKDVISEPSSEASARKAYGGMQICISIFPFGAVGPDTADVPTPKSALSGQVEFIAFQRDVRHAFGLFARVCHSSLVFCLFAIRSRYVCVGASCGGDPCIWFVA